jgi:predicted ribosome quality control (RQC) complex YloA/Tae2 family protein
MRFSIDARKTIPENAQHYYEEAKKAQRKVEGAKIALEETKKKVAELEEKRKLLEEESSQTTPEKKEKREKKWFDAFRSFSSSDGFLVVGGRDADSNEGLIKRHVEKEDLIFHADVQGAPFFVIKNPEGKEISESTLAETAAAAASYSKAWQANWGSCDVYYVKPEQVTKTANAGEYVPKGAFMIYGTKNWFRGTALMLAIGYSPEEGVVAGPVSAVEKKTKRLAKIIPGDKKSKELAEDIKKSLLRAAGKEESEKIKSIKLDDIQRLIPAGKGRLAK